MENEETPLNEWPAKLELPALSAEQWLEQQGLGGSRTPVLLYLRQLLSDADKQSIALDSVEQYLQGVLAAYAEDPAPRNDWPLPPASFHEVVQDVLSKL
jgi:hypothetical protein